MKGPGSLHRGLLVAASIVLAGMVGRPPLALEAPEPASPVLPPPATPPPANPSPPPPAPAPKQAQKLAQAQKPAARATPARAEEPLEFDLELDAAEEVVQRFARRPKELAAAKAKGSELLLAYGYALKAAGKNDKALEPLLDYHTAKGKLASYAALLLGESLLELDQYEEAARWLTEALGAFPAGERQVQVRYGLARARLYQGEAQQAARDLEQLLADAPKSRRRHEIRLRLSQAYEQAGQLEQAIEALEWLWAWAPAAPEAEVAGREMARHQEARTASYSGPNVAVRYRRALQLLKSGQVEPGLILMLALAQDPAVTASLPRSFTFELGKAYFQAKQYTEAAEQLDLWYSRTRGSERTEALFWRALTQGRLARFEESISLYRQLVREYPKSSFAETAMMKIGLLRLDQGRYDLSEEAFAAYRDRYPKSNQADTAQWYVAWSQLRLGRDQAAQASLEELVKRYPRSSLVSRARYWQGRIAQLQGDRQQAISWYRQVLQSPYASHYHALAEIRLQHLGVVLEEKPVDKPAEAAPALQLPHPEALERVTLLLSLGLRTWAQEELKAYQHGLKGRDEFLALGDWYRRTGNYAGARLIVANLGLGEGVPKLRDPGLTWQLSYPQAYKQQLAEVKLHPKVPWELIYAIMRQESEFQPWATSRVGARGLLQVMPETAREVCQSRKVASPPVNSLYKPAMSVQFGAWHLEDLMNRLEGRLPLVIAAYNAGPEAVERWMKERPVDPIDVFMEEISYTETRSYVRKVLTNLWIYRRLYADGRTALAAEPGLDKPIKAVRLPPPARESGPAVAGPSTSGEPATGPGSTASGPASPASTAVNEAGAPIDSEGEGPE